MKALPSLQVGGTHYQSSFPHVSLAQRFGPWCEMNVVKYVSRHHKKNGAEDIKKAISYALLRLRESTVTTSYAGAENAMRAFCAENNITGQEAVACLAVASFMQEARTVHLDTAMKALRRILMSGYGVDYDDPTPQG